MATEYEKPQTLTKALNTNKKDKWKAAWESELTSLAKNNTWELEPLPDGQTAIGRQWLFNKKEDGRYKGRLVAKGYSQKFGIDYSETFAPVAKFITIRVLLALCCENDWEVEGMDVKTAFLNSELEESVYMEIPEELSVPTKSPTLDYGPPLVCRLLKSIYGLRQSPRAWYGWIHTFFLANVFVRSESDHSLFINYGKSIVLLLYVDDLVLATPVPDAIAWIKNKLHAEFEMTDMGEVRPFLGLEIECNQRHRTLHLSQTKYITKILADHGMSFCNLLLTPADPHIRLVKSSPEFTATAEEKQKYQSAVGSLIYAMLGTRPDLAYAVSRVCQYSTNPSPMHWTAVKRIFRYLAGSIHRGLYFGKQGERARFTDAYWVSQEDRKSIGGYTFILNAAAVCWNSKKQNTVALSSTEAEYMALTQAVKESLWLQALLSDLGAKKDLSEIRNICIDNQRAIALAHNPEYHARTKHIEIQYHFIREHIETGAISLTYCQTSDMTADIFTKVLPHSAFTKHNLALGLVDQSVPLLLQQFHPDDSDTWEEQQDGSTGEGRDYLFTGAQSDVRVFSVWSEEA